MSTIMISDIMERHIKNICSEYGTHIVKELSTKYKFDAEEAIRTLDMSVDIKRNETTNKRKTNNDKKDKKEKETRIVPSIPLPFCGIIVETWCKAITKNNNLYTQCTNKPDDDSICKKCSKNETLPFGLITDRIDAEFKDKKGNAPVAYAVVLKKMNIDRETAVAEALKFGWTIPEEQFVIPEKSRGRPKKTEAEKSESDDDDKKTKRGRPKKDKPTKASSQAGDDIIANLLAKAQNKQADEEKEITEENSQSEHSQTEHSQSEHSQSEHSEAPKAPKAPKAPAKDKEAEKVAAKAIKEAEKNAKEAEKNAAKANKEAEKVAAKAIKQANKAAKETAKVKEVIKKAENVTKVVVPTTNEDKELQQEKVSEESSEEEEEEQAVKVTKFEHDGKKYKMSSDNNILYGWEDDEPIGVWNDKTKQIDSLPEESDDEDEE